MAIVKNRFDLRLINHLVEKTGGRLWLMDTWTRWTCSISPGFLGSLTGIGVVVEQHRPKCVKR